MKSNLIKLPLLILLLLTLFCITGCSSSEDQYEGKVKAVFYLEGGYCQNTKDKMSYYYDFKEGVTEVLIVDPNELETDENKIITKEGYSIEGWYKTKIENSDGTVEYADKWDFSNDRMTKDGVILYAHWVKDVIYRYELWYYDSTNTAVYLGGYETNANKAFSDIRIKNKTVSGYTSIGYLDENGEPWDENFVHPGGDEDLTIKVFLNLIEGEYDVVETATEFKKAIKNNKNIYLLNDIDASSTTMNFDSYSGTILGNGYTISNATIDYADMKDDLKPSLDDSTSSKDNLYISLFYELKDAYIKDLSFENVTIDVNTNNSLIKNIVVAPFAIKSSNTKLENVHMSGTIIYTKSYNGIIPEYARDFFYKDDNNTIDEYSTIQFEYPIVN